MRSAPRCRLEHLNMKQKLIVRSQRFVTALRQHPKQGSGASLEPALRLGSKAGALDTLKLSGGKNGRVKRVEFFYPNQTCPRQLTHRVPVAKEFERQHLSRELQDDIVQTLFGIKVRRFALQRKARSNSRGLKKEIASTQRLVVSSANSVRRFARQLGVPQPA